LEAREVTAGDAGNVDPLAAPGLARFADGLRRPAEVVMRFVEVL